MIRGLIALAASTGTMKAGVGVQTAGDPIPIYNPTHNTTANLNYIEFLPPGYDDPANSARKYPLIVFLHGYGERPSAYPFASYLVDPKNGPAKAVMSDSNFLTFTINGESESFILLSPHVDTGFPNREVTGLLKHAIQQYRVDEARIYLTGLSYGGTGSWGVVASEENDAAGNYFAAVVPMASTDIPTGVGTKTAAWNVPVWSFSGDNDSFDTNPNNPNLESLKPILEMIAAGNTPGVTIFVGANHSTVYGRGYKKVLPTNPPYDCRESHPQLPADYPLLPFTTNIYAWMLGHVRPGMRNARPEVDGGGDRTVLLDDFTLLEGAVSDDGIPIGSAISCGWSKTSGPGMVTFDPPNQPITSVRFSQTGTYELALSASDTERTTHRPVIIDVIDPNADGSIFFQDFSSTLAGAVSATPSNSDLSRFNDIGQDANGGTWSVNASGQLQLDKPAAVPGVGSGAGFIRLADFAGPLDLMRMEFDFGVLLNESANAKDLAIPAVGNFETAGSYAANEGANLVAERWSIRSKINPDGSRAFLIRHNGANSSLSLPADGEMHRFVWFLNVGPERRTYAAPNGSVQTLDPFCSSIWVDGAPWVGNHPREAIFGVDRIRNMKFRLSAGVSSTMKFDNIKVTSLTSPTPLEAWRQMHGMAPDGSQDLQAPAGDGVANLLKYALNLAPQAGDLSKPAFSMTAEGAAGLPYLHTAEDPQRVSLTFVRRRVGSRPGISYVAQQSDDLVNWTPCAEIPQVVPLNAAWERVTYTQNVAGASRRFLRMQVQAP